jgi:hypothetical protein
MAVELNLGELAGRAIYGLSDSELRTAVDEVFGCRALLDGLALALVRELDGRDLAVRDGASSTTAWLAGRERISGGLAHRCVRIAKAVDGTATGEALRAGRMNLEQADVITHAIRRVPGERRVEAEETLVAYASVFGPQTLVTLGKRILTHTETDTETETETAPAEPGGTPRLDASPSPAARGAAARLEVVEQRAVAGRELWLTDTPDGRVRVTCLLDSEGGNTVRTVLGALCRPCPADRLDPRSPARKRADALVEVCELVMASGRLPRNGGDPVQVAVTVPLATLRDQVGVATLDDGSALSPAAARRLACDAGIIPAVLGGASQPLDVGRQRRLVTGPLRRAVLLRDRGCSFPGCDRPPSWTSIHHATHWVDGGVTSLGNSAALCRHHHRTIHYGQWKLTINPVDGYPDFWPPDHLGISGPLRNQLRAGP